MIGRIRRLPKSEDDLIEIWTYIAQHDQGAADRLLDLIDDRLRLLESHPKLGRLRPDIAPTVRMVWVRTYAILYRLTGPDIEVVRVVHGARRLDRLE